MAQVVKNVPCERQGHIDLIVHIVNIMAVMTVK